MTQDEAALRFRTLERESNEATRSRSSKVQMTCCSLRAGAGGPMEIYTELEGLADKTAATLATSLEKVTRATAALVGDATPSGTVGAGQGAARYVFTHILVGDGIATNAKAARILWAAAQENPPHGNLWYLLLVVVCASHSTNLTVASVARGRIAQSALANAAVGAGGGQSAADARDRAQSESAVHRQACGMIVRYPSSGRTSAGGRAPSRSKIPQGAGPRRPNARWRCSACIRSGCSRMPPSRC